MKRNPRFLVLATCLGVLMLCQVALVAAEKEPVVGLNIGNVSFSAPLNAEDVAYLGLTGPAAFTLSDIKSPYVLIESMHTTCPHSIALAPVMNELYRMVAGDPSLKNKIKFVAAAQGEGQSQATAWKRFKKVPFAVVPDLDSRLSAAMNFGPYPVALLVDKSGTVLWVNVGEFANVDGALKGIKNAVK